MKLRQISQEGLKLSFQVQYCSNKEPGERLEPLPGYLRTHSQKEPSPEPANQKEDAVRRTHSINLKDRRCL